ncbi:MAG: TIGR00341 family protein [Parvibaculum sp.]|uniref:TIGR00341 family protein n=1 Tax=Parvibaculum sp. TaxID=2024848 RepID=UPI0025E70AE6|nr:TIGR00341 family protein [Parvibaculum sp.]MCE9651075.1 TIGR00341 family protein [Parvibaculum sp.]
MPVRLIEVIARDGHADTLEATASQFKALEFHRGQVDENGMQVVRLLARTERQQDLIDHLQKCLGTGDDWRIVLLPVDAILPDPEPLEEQKKSSTAALREELYVEIARGAKMDQTFIVLVLLSTVVAAIGLFNDNVAVIIAAMVIAPLLGPNMALAFGSALGDSELIGRAALANLVGIGLAIGGAVVAGLLLPDKYSGVELLSRTTLGYDSVALALASGAAGAISLTTRASSVLVGVMVAVALMPPAAATGYMLGTERYALAAGAGSLLAVNIVCINLSAQVVFLAKGIKPRSWIEQRAAKESTFTSLAIWSALLAALIAVIAWQHG